MGLYLKKPQAQTCYRSDRRSDRRSDWRSDWGSDRATNAKTRFPRTGRCR